MTKPPLYWVRLGDASDYDSYDDLEDLTPTLLDAKVQHPISWRNGGLTAAGGYEGQNYISLYVGDADANLVRDLNAEEKKFVEANILHK